MKSRIDKERAVFLIEEEGLSYSQVGKIYGVSYNAIGRMYRDYLARGRQFFVPKGKTITNAENSKRWRESMRARGICVVCGKNDAGVSIRAGRHSDTPPRKTALCNECKAKRRRERLEHKHCAPVADSC